MCAWVGGEKWVGVGAHASLRILSFEIAGIEGGTGLGKSPAGFSVCTAKLPSEKSGSSSLSSTAPGSRTLTDSDCRGSLAAVSAVTDMLMHGVLSPCVGQTFGHVNTDEI